MIQVGALDTPVPQGRQHSIWKPDDLLATKSPAGTNHPARTAIRHRCAR